MAKQQHPTTRTMVAVMRNQRLQAVRESEGFGRPVSSDNLKQLNKLLSGGNSFESLFEAK